MNLIVYFTDFVTETGWGFVVGGDTSIDFSTSQRLLEETTHIITTNSPCQSGSSLLIASDTSRTCKFRPIVSVDKNHDLKKIKTI